MRTSTPRLGTFAPARTGRAHRLFTVRLSTIAYLGLVGLLVFLFVAPVGWLLLSSVKGPAEFAATPPTYLPKAPTLDNYRSLADSGIWGYAWNSVVVTAGTVLCVVVLSTLAGYGFSRFRFRFQGPLLLIVLSTLMIPFQSVTPALYTILDAVGLTNSRFGLVLLYTLFALPFGVLTMRVAFDAVPTALEEAAVIDGLSSLQVLVRVMAPLTVPGLATVALYAFFSSWNEFIAALIFTTRQDRFTLPVALSNLQTGAAGTLNWGVLETGAVVSALPCIAIFLILQRYYVAGLTGGGVKE